MTKYFHKLREGEAFLLRYKQEDIKQNIIDFTYIKIKILLKATPLLFFFSFLFKHFVGFFCLFALRLLRKLTSQVQIDRFLVSSTF